MDREVFDANLATLQGAIQVSELAERSGETYLRQEGKRLRGPCPLPIHEGSSPSFYCYDDAGSGFYSKWRCHRCGVGGDVLDLHEAMYGPFSVRWHAMEDLSERFNVKLWKPSDLKSDNQLEIARLQREAQRRVGQAWTAMVFKAQVMPIINAIPNARTRAETLEACRKAAGL